MMHEVTHFALIQSEGRPRYRMKRIQFVPHNGFSKHFPKRERSLAHFAECLAEGCSGYEAARRSGYSTCSASRLKKQLSGTAA